MLQHLTQQVMKNFIVIIGFLICSLVSFSQATEAADGLYHDAQGNLYTGEVSGFFDNGQVRMKSQIVNGAAEGVVMFYNEGGWLEETGSYITGKKHGLWNQFNNKGVKVGEATYSAGLKDGVWTVWDDNHVKRYHMVYSKGKKIDVWKMWDENSNLVSERVY